MRTRARLTLAGLVLGAALTGGVAWATIPAADGTIHGCYLTKNGSLRIVESAAGCKKTELPISWNVKGADGKAGIDGKPGLDGAAGPRGADGTNGTKGDPCPAADPACVGPKGDEGVKGDTGAQGPAGPHGLVGPQGPAGPPGPAGQAGQGGQLESSNGRYKIQVDNDGIVLDGGLANGIVRIGPSGIAVYQGPNQLLMNATSVYLSGPGGGQLVLAGGGARIDTATAGMLDMGVETAHTILRGPGSSSFLQLTARETQLGGAGAGITLATNNLGASQLVLGANWVEVAAGKVGLGGFCRGIVREDVDTVQNSYQFYAPLSAGGWENGIIPDASTVAYAC